MVNIDAWRNNSGEIERIRVDGVELNTGDIVEFKIDIGTVANISVLLSELYGIIENMEDENGRQAALDDMRDLIDGILISAAESEREERRPQGLLIPFPYGE